MSEVKRYRFVDANGYPATRVLDNVNGARYVAEQCFDAVQAQLAALREELTAEKTGAQGIYQQLEICQKQRDNLQQRLTAAEQRNAEQLKLIAGLVQYADNLLGDVNNAWSYAGSTGNPETHKDDDYAAAVALIAKPTESGASE